MTDVSIDYDLGQHGWSSFTLRVGDRAVEVGTFGYCTDALGDIVRAALAMAAGSWRARVSLDAEPFEWRLVLVRRPYRNGEAAQLDLQILTFPDIYAEAPDTEGALKFEAICDVEAFARAVAQAAGQVWERHGADGYNQLWAGHEGFPLRALAALTTALGTSEAPRPVMDVSSLRVIVAAAPDA